MAWPEPFVYYGTSDFSRRILLGLLAAGLRPSRVITTAAKPAGRGLKTTRTPVAAAAHEHGLPVAEVATLRTSHIQKQLAAGNEPVAVLAAFGKILPPEVLELYPKGIVNVHPSLLPLYRGPAPIQYAIRDGKNETGVSLILLDEDIDHGPILAQQLLAIELQDDTETLGAKLADLAVALLLESLPRYLAGELTPQPQDHSKVTFTKMVERHDGEADFTKSAVELDRQRRAFTPWPGLWTTWRGQRLKLVATRVVPNYSGQSGLAAHSHEGIVVGCTSGGLLVTELQLEGGKVLAAANFLRGHPGLASAHLPS